LPREALDERWRLYEVSATMPLSPAVKSQIEELIEKNKVVLFMKGNKHFPQCGFSARVIKMLNEVGAKYETVNVLSDANIREGIKEFSEWPTIPQLYVNKEFLGGCDIVTEMFNSGELQKALGVTPEEVKVPAISFSESAARAFKEAEEAGTTLRIEITPEFQYELFFDAPQDSDIVAQVGTIEVRMNRPTAKRADGMRIDYVEVDGGGAFKIENPNEPARVKSMRVEELAQLIAAGEKVELFDVRTPEERAIAKLDNTRLFDAEGEAYLAKLPKDAKVVFMCHHGGRSRTAAERSLKDGFRNVYNLEGGIDAWSQRVDTKVPRY
jgi:monothiol glutaredoxin